MKPFILLVGITLLSGCGGPPPGPELLPVTGSVKLDGEPLTDADVSFYPEGTETPGNGGRGRSDANGEFTVTYARGGEGLPAGTYKVTVSRRLMPDGEPVPPDDDTPPIESPAVETMPTKYSSFDETSLTATVATDTPIQLDLKSE